jgi:eukaryotic-like serine/threonine-protein kinase
MTPELWKRIKEIFETALEKNLNDRKAYLDTECAGDPSIRSEVDSLLLAHRSTTKFLETQIINTDFFSESDAESDPLLGKEFRSYKIEKRIGSGGMASVYLASRIDKEFEKKVAIKFIKRGMDTDEIIKRFKTERNALANLDHPNIGMILDGGTTDDGLPYFIMEYIDGKPIDEFCADKKLSIKERLILFRKVCEAVQYAHQNLIVHRDLKPSNILVNEDGHPKLLDFGIAKILSSDDSKEETKLTKIGTRIMTLEYASPEQVKGAKITTASDIYSLGVMLYELLTGCRPYKFKDRPPNEAEKIITSEHPVKPSSAVKYFNSENENDEELRISFDPKNWKEENSSRLSKHLAGDLDNIILMALRKEPERRYSSVSQFSEDIKRYLKALPVHAHKDSIGYRTTKFIRRHKIAVASSAVIFILLITSIILVAWQANVAANERDKALLEAEKAEQINIFLNEMLSAVDPEKYGKDVKVSEVLDEASKKISTDLRPYPEIEADVRTTIGITYQNLGLYEEGKVHLQRAYDIRDSLFGPAHYKTAYSSKNLALLLHYQWDDNAREYYEKSIRLLRQNAPYPDKALAEALNDYGTLLTELYEFEEAEKIQRESLKMYMDLYGHRSKDVAAGLNNLGLTLHSIGNLDSAEKYYRESGEINKFIHGEESLPVSYNLNNLAFVFNERGNGIAAESLFTAAYEIRKNSLGEDHPATINTKYNRAAQRFQLGRLSEAEIDLTDCLNKWKKKLPEDHVYIANAYAYLGKVQNEMDRLLEAEANLKKAVRIRKGTYPEGNEMIVKTENDLANSYILQKRYVEAERLLLKNMSLVDEDEANKKIIINLMVKLYKAWGNPDKENHYSALLEPAE